MLIIWSRIVAFTSMTAADEEASIPNTIIEAHINASEHVGDFNPLQQTPARGNSEHFPLRNEFPDLSLGEVASSKKARVYHECTFGHLLMLMHHKGFRLDGHN